MSSSSPHVCPGPRKALIVTGEASGDLHGANLIKAARQQDPELTFCGVGGEKMAAAGCEILIPSSELSVMGLVEVLRHLPRIWRVFQQLKQRLFSDQAPDVVILIDSPDFNLRLAKQAKKAGIPVLYYVSPQVWAWRKGRVKGISAVVDQLAAIFPFEPECYRGYPIDVRYVGHPLLDEASRVADVDEIRQRYGLADRLTIGLFPGSRQNELTYSFPTIVETAAKLRHCYPDANFLVPLAPGVDEQQLSPPLKSVGVEPIFVRDNIYDTAAVCDVVLCVSGTVTLQVALTETPMAILYKAAPLTYAIGKHLVSVEFIGLPNIVAGKSVVREFIQDDANPQALFEEVQKILSDDQYHQTMKQNLADVRHRMGEPGCSSRVAEMASGLSCQHVQKRSLHGRA
nr:lipid-A-disaccharide synthase [uncultured Desulfuromonas sp.]